MNKGVGKKKRLIALCVAVMLCTSALTQATILNVEAIRVSIPGQFYTYASGSGSLYFSAKSCIVPTFLFDDGSSDYSITGTKLTLSSALINDTSSGGMARGLFQGGRTLTITGTLKYKPTNTTILPANSTLIVANMDITSSETWSMAELPAITINGSVYFHPDTTIGLGMGVVHGSNTLKLGLFRLDCAFANLSPNPDNFSTGNISGLASTIGVEAIPEPATILLFTTAALALRIRNFKERN